MIARDQIAGNKVAALAAASALEAAMVAVAIEAASGEDPGVGTMAAALMKDVDVKNGEAKKNKLLFLLNKNKLKNELFWKRSLPIISRVLDFNSFA